MLALAGELDLATRPDLERVLAQAVDAETGDLVVDLAAVTFIDAGTARCFARAAGRLDRRRRLVVQNPTRLVARVLALTDVDRVVTVERGVP